METKQTALEYMEAYLDLKARYYSKNYLKLLIEKAKQIEKEQIIDAHFTGWCDAYDYLKDDFSAPRQAEDYYNETYGK